jgi:tetratricopeptide (TPR) repeat protein
LDSSELWWSRGGRGDLPGQQDLIREANEAATTLADDRSHAVAALLAGRYAVGAGTLPEAVALLGDAARYARSSGDELLLLDALTLLGHHTVGLSLTKGAALLDEARSVADRIARLPSALSEPALWDLRVAKLQCMAGVAAFDSGRFDAAEDLLVNAVDGAAAAGFDDLRATATNYLCQMLTGAGRFRAAESLMAAEIELMSDYADDSPHQAYNRALLGKIRIEDGRPQDAEDDIVKAWTSLSKHPHEGTLTLVRNYLAELLIHNGYAGRDLARADQLLEESLADCRRTGFQRSEIAALCLRAMIYGEQERHTDAYSISGEAKNLLEAAGGCLPALRTEEVYYTHYVASAAIGRDADAASALESARSTVLAKADSIADPQLRAVFLGRVPINAALFAVQP